jgi:hypothetical protein
VTQVSFCVCSVCGVVQRGTPYARGFRVRAHSTAAGVRCEGSGTTGHYAAGEGWEPRKAAS